jgi:hypothetical protein
MSMDASSIPHRSSARHGVLHVRTCRTYPLQHLSTETPFKFASDGTHLQHQLTGLKSSWLWEKESLWFRHEKLSPHPRR